MTIDGFLPAFKQSSWLLKQKARALMVANLVIMAAAVLDAVISSLSFGYLTPNYIADVIIFTLLLSSVALLLKGRYVHAASVGVGGVIIGAVTARLLSTGRFSVDPSYDIIQLSLDLVIVIFYAGLFAERYSQILSSIVLALLLQGIYSGMEYSRVEALTSGTISVILSGFLFLALGGFIAFFTFRLNHEAIKVAVNESHASLQSERKVRAIFDLSFQFIGLLSPDGRLIDANRTALDFAGIKLPDVVGKPFWETPWWSHTTIEQDRLKEAIRQAAAGHMVRYEATHPGPDGTLHTIDFSLKPIRDENGNVTYLIPEGRDITERKRSEEEIVKSRRELQQLSQRLTDSLEEERKRVSREIHDELGQLLTILKFDIMWLDGNTKRWQKGGREKIESLKGTVTAALSAVKRISRELRPVQLDALQLAGALQWDLDNFDRRFGIRGSLRVVPPDLTVDRERSAALYRVFQEALTNVARHAQASLVIVELGRSNDRLVLSIRDNGVGFQPENVRGGSLGIVGMKERVRQWNGTMAITGVKGQGTLVQIEIPLPAEGLSAQG